MYGFFVRNLQIWYKLQYELTLQTKKFFFCSGEADGLNKESKKNVDHIRNNVLPYFNDVRGRQELTVFYGF